MHDSLIKASRLERKREKKREMSVALGATGL